MTTPLKITRAERTRTKNASVPTVRAKFSFWGGGLTVYVVSPENRPQITPITQIEICDIGVICGFSSLANPNVYCKRLDCLLLLQERNE
jgi:hypothetical protein